MAKYSPTLFFLTCISLPVAAWSADRMLFWNLTGTKITKLYLAPAGTDKWSPDQCANDPDASVDPDERLKLVGITPGHYDVRLTEEGGRTCTVNNVTVESGKPYAFSISESELKNCSEK